MCFCWLDINFCMIICQAKDKLLSYQARFCHGRRWHCCTSAAPPVAPVSWVVKKLMEQTKLGWRCRWEGHRWEESNRKISKIWVEMWKVKISTQVFGGCFFVLGDVLVWWKAVRFVRCILGSFDTCIVLDVLPSLEKPRSRGKWWLQS